MDSLTSEHRVTLILGLFILVGVISLAHIVRSTYLKRPIGSSWMKMYLSFIIITVVGALALANVITGDALTALLGSIAGYVLGTKQDGESN